MHECSAPSPSLAFIPVLSTCLPSSRLPPGPPRTPVCWLRAVAPTVVSPESAGAPHAKAHATASGKSVHEKADAVAGSAQLVDATRPRSPRTRGWLHVPQALCTWQRGTLAAVPADPTSRPAMHCHPLSPTVTSLRLLAPLSSSSAPLHSIQHGRLKGPVPCLELCPEP